MLEKYSSIYFIGIGGVGMSGLAGWCHDKKYNVSGYDRNENQFTLLLKSKGVLIEHDVKKKISPKYLNIDNTLIVYTPAIKNTHTLFRFFSDKNYKIIKRSDLLRYISLQYKVIAVAGTHGKTTVSIMIAHILTSAGYAPSAFFGGFSLNYGSNYIVGNSKYMIIEADEYDRSFLKLNPSISIVTSIDQDHIDTYSSYRDMINAYVNFCYITYKNWDKDVYKNPDFNSNIFMSEDASNKLGDILSQKKKKWEYNTIPVNLKSNQIVPLLPAYMSEHNIVNFIMASVVTKQLGINNDQIIQSIKCYKGIKRRFEYHSNTKKLILIDDYAHHPKELNVLIQSVRKLHFDKKIFMIFQPHLFSRTQHLQEGFVEALSAVDSLALLDIYPARELPIVGVSSKEILSQIKLLHKWHVNSKNIFEVLRKVKPNLIVLSGAGDIYKLIPNIKSLYA